MRHLTYADGRPIFPTSTGGDRDWQQERLWSLSLLSFGASGLSAFHCISGLACDGWLHGLSLCSFWNGRG